MRAPTRRLVLATALLHWACEDGPKQIYNPPPASAGSSWNDGRTAPSVDPASAGFGTQTGGTNRQEICTGQQKATRWAAMVREVIAPPRKAAGLDMAGGDDWHGLTVEAAEHINCQSDSQGDAFGDGTLVNSWGDNGEVWVQYLVSTHKIIQMTLWPGYEGAMEFKSRDQAHTYRIPVYSQIRKDGQPFTLDWIGNGGRNFIPAADELYRALIATYAPGLPVDPANVTCFDTGRCIKGSFGDVAYWYVPALGFAIWIDNQNASQPTPSIPTRVDLSPAKIMPYAFANPLLKLDQEGPIASAGKLGNATVDCTLKMGLTYEDFLARCVKVTGNTAADATEFNKLLGGLTHSTERFSFDVQGVDINFSDKTLPPDDIIHDMDRPTNDDIATTFSVDQSTLGYLQNDTTAQGQLDLHGTGAVYKEYARLVRQNLLSYKGVTDGDVTRCLFPSPPPRNFDPRAFLASLPAFCTGFEGIITPAPPVAHGDRNNLGATAALAIQPSLKLGLRLGHQQVTFCLDANGDPSTGYAYCGDDPYGAHGDIFQTSFAQVLKIFGKGRTTNLPADVQDVRFFFKMYFMALVKYLSFAATENPVTTNLATKNLDMDNLFFDSIGAGQFEIAEYVDRRFASKTQDPTDFVLTADVRNGIFATYEFSRDIFRGETAIYVATLEDQNHGVGEETALLSNIFGSPVLANAYVDSSAGKTAYYCATNLDPDNCDGQTPPLDAAGDVLNDDMGRPLLAPYRGAFGGGSAAFRLGATPIKILQTYPDIQSAKVRVPIHTNPYDAHSPALAPQEFLVPWVPKQPGIGFPVALSGTLDKFVETAQLDFSGTTISANVDYDFVIDPQTGQPAANGALKFLAVETTDFLGEVFLCQDPQTGDLLHARMYSPAAALIQWIAQHPAAQQGCGIIVRYSPYNNYPDYITSLNGGVRLGITQGGGSGRVVDVTLFVPGQ